MTATARSPQLIWSTDAADKAALRASGYEVLSYAHVRRSVIDPGRDPDRKPSLVTRNTLVEQYPPGSRLAITGVVLNTAGDLRDVYGYLVEPGFRHDWDLRLFANRSFADLRPENLVEPSFGYPFTYERLAWVLERYERRPGIGGLPPLTPIEQQLYRAMVAAGLTPRAQFGIGPYAADFAFPEARLTVEADGRGWHDEHRDRERDERLARLGWTVLRFTGSAIYQDAPACAEDVARALADAAPTVVSTDLEDDAERMSWWRRLLNRLLRRRSSPVLVSLDTASVAVIADHDRLDDEQRRAVGAHDGVVQIIAPAGSGKTTVIVSRAAELAARGVPEHRILCSTFNAATRRELEAKLAQRGLAGVNVLTFNALGRRILDRQGVLRSDLRTFTMGQLRRLARDAKASVTDGVWIDAPDAQELISEYKLAQMIDPPEAVERAKSPIERTGARLYQLYEEEFARIDANDFDDQILRSVQLLQRDPAARTRWQGEWWSVLVDEYQDIEPAQELLIQLIAAPHDCMFTVGDEDQVLYAWRRASVDRIVDLDVAYPGLGRIVLAHNYRCPVTVINAAKKLVEHNQHRFEKAMLPAPDAAEGEIEIIEASTPQLGAKEVAARIGDCDAQDTAVLARTSKALREVALACVDANVPFRASPRVLQPSHSERTVQSYLCLIAAVHDATDDDVRRVFDVPNRYLPDGYRGVVLQRLREGDSFTQALSSLDRLESWRRDALDKAGPFLDRLRGVGASAFVALLRGDDGGLDKYYGDQEQLNVHDQVELDTLDDIQRMAAEEATCAGLLERLTARRAALEGSSSDEGVELTTIHGAKGREWGTVVLYGADVDLLPHARALDDAETEAESQEIVEDERRLAYVAFTRARGPRSTDDPHKLVIVHTSDRASPFLFEAGLLEGEPPALAPRDGRRSTDSGRPKRPAVTAGGRGSRVMTAKFRSRCPVCRKPIAPGSDIERSKTLDSWVHAGCA